MSSFEKELSIPVEEIEFELRGMSFVPWANFLLNPRRLRGSDFIMRWAQGVWSEKRIIEALGKTKKYFAIPYGTSSTAPTNDIRKYELYFELLDKAGHGSVKRPDLLVFREDDRQEVEEIIDDIESRHKIPFILSEDLPGREYLQREEIFPFISEEDSGIQTLLSKAIIAVESENSLWKAKQMPDFGKALRPMRRLGGKLGLPKNAVLPTIIVKDEDLKPLSAWQEASGVPIHVWHVFFDVAYGISFDKIQDLIQEGLIEPISNTYQAPNGTTTVKTIYKIYYHYAYQLAEASEKPNLEARYIVDKNGHILPYVKFSGGALTITEEAIAELEKIEGMVE